MTATVTTSPDVAMPRRQCVVSFTANAVGANHLRAWLTDAPYGSQLRGRLDASGAGRLIVYEGDSGGTWAFEPDTGGVYVLAVQEYTKGGAGGGGYRGSPLGYTTETKVGSEATVSVNVAQRLRRRVGSGIDVADLVLWVSGTTIAATTIATHGEKTPAILGARTARARIAARSTTVEAAVAALGGASTTAATSLLTVLADYVENFNAHLTQATVHANNDSDNTIPAEIVAAATSEAGIVYAANRCRELTVRHMTNDAGEGDGPGGANYHDDRIDWGNLPYAKAAGNLAEASTLIADLWRAFEAHRVSVNSGTGVHEAADATNTLAALPADLDVDRYFTGVLAMLAPPAPPTENAGVATMVGSRGFGDG